MIHWGSSHDSSVEAQAAHGAAVKQNVTLVWCILLYTGQSPAPRPAIGEHTYAPPLPPHATPTHVSTK